MLSSILYTVVTVLELSEVLHYRNTGTPREDSSIAFFFFFFFFFLFFSEYTKTLTALFPWKVFPFPLMYKCLIFCMS